MMTSSKFPNFLVHIITKNVPQVNVHISDFNETQ